ncbi:MAG TPA: protein translocase subunit SecD [Micromonosporaceae bacterium]
MAAPSGPLKVTRYFAVLAVIIAGLYALVFFTGNHKPHPKLGLDLQGGTSMTLSATTPDGKAPDAAKLDQARQIIASRVNDTGVTEAEVITEGSSNIVVNVAGKQTGEQLRQLVQPAELRFRAVLGTAQDNPAPESTPAPSPSGSATPSGSAKPSASASANASATPSPSGSASASAAPTPSASAAPVSESVEKQREAVIAKLGPVYQLAQGISDPNQVDQNTLAALKPFGDLAPAEVAVLPADIQYKVPTITCKQLNGRPVGSISDPKQQVTACDSGTSAHTKYQLDVAKVLGTDVSNATSGYDTQQGWHVTLSFKGSGQDRWTKLTQEAKDKEAKDGQQHAVAIVLDNSVVSAPNIQSVITGDAIINGGDINQDSARTLAAQLKYGSLPLTFKIQTVSDVTATLGLQQMKAGLLAGAIGLALVVLYCLFYYRALGLVVIASLGVSAAIVYAALVLLGRSMGFTLSLAGIAGFIVAIGITADSFVVFFERLKDEVKDGRSVRSAVPKAWERARRTILSADTVSILAALILYLLATGAVRGFAFTLGMSTIFDLLIVFLFTHPLVALLSRSKTFGSPRFSGLGGMRPTKTTASSLGTVRTKES